MVKSIFIISFLLCGKVFQGQQLIGRVFDAISKMPVSYASVGLINGNKGTTANLDGYFELNYPLTSPRDSLIFSCVGYQTIILPVENNNRSYDVLLERNAPLLQEVFIRKHSKQFTFPWNTKNSTPFYTRNENSHTQIARLMETPLEFTKLESVTLAIAKSKNVSRFRIRIYDYDSIQNKPGIDLCDSIIEVQGKGIVTISLDKYQIIIPQKRFFVAVQWLFIAENIAGKVFNERTGSYEYYKPGIRMLQIAGKGNSWFQYHSGYWVRWEADMCLSATVSY